jgi:hypothetical protein
MDRNTLKAFKDLIDNALLGFEMDPSDSDYQRGYEAALKEVKKNLDTVENT